MIGVLFCGSVFGQEKKETEQKPSPKIGNVYNVLFLEIIEDNWDNIEIHHVEKEKLGQELEKKSFVEYNIHKEIFSKEFIDIVAKNISNREKVKVIVVHRLKYLKNFDELKDNELVRWRVGRFGEGYFIYTLPGILGKISISKPGKPLGWYKENFYEMDYIRFWRDFKWVRFVYDINITEADDTGNIKIIYNNQTYNCRVGTKMELPLQYRKLSSLKFQWDDITGQWRKGEDIPGCGKWGSYEKYKIQRNLAVWPEDKNFKEKFFYIHTKITILNHGFIKTGN